MSICPLVKTRKVTTLNPMVFRELMPRMVLQTDRKSHGSQSTGKPVKNPCHRTKKAVKG